jgi:hypothetical protein
MTAVRKDTGKVWEQIPDSVKTEEFLIAVLEISPSKLFMIPEISWTEAMIASAVDHSSDKRIRAKIKWMWKKSKQIEVKSKQIEVKSKQIEVKSA